MNHGLNELNTNQDANKMQIKKFILIYIFVLLFSFSFTLAHTEDAELDQEIQKGKDIVEKFYRGEVKC
jgi:ABC-type phosphate/phosphonate transport system permease subunit